MKIADKTTSAVSMVKEALEKAKKYQKSHNIFVSILEEDALARAKEIDTKIANGENAGRLAGVPYVLKDNFLSKSGNTTASSKILEPFHSPITATSVEKLENEGAICIGRANMDSFAHGSSTENSYFGATKNSVDTERVAGGSSGGSAVAVALDIVPFATGTDTGGSIRQPASFNGVYGFKPTYGTISRYGVVAMASSTDCIGFFAKTPEDIDLLMSITSGQDPKDMTTLPDYYNDSLSDGGSQLANSDLSGSTEEYYENSDTAGPVGGSAETVGASPVTTGAGDRYPQVGDSRNYSKSGARSETSEASVRRVGIIKEFDNDAVDSSIRNALSYKIEKLKAKGYGVVELSMPALKYALAVYYIVVPAEISSNLSRHDGIRYGYSYGKTDKSSSVGPKTWASAPERPKEEGFGRLTLQDVYANSRSEGFMPENKRRIMIGNFVLSSGFYDAYYLKAQKARTLIIKEYEKAFEKVDFLLTPVAPNPAFKLGEKVGDPVAMYLEDVMSVPINLAGLPGLTIPAGTTESGLPIGLQLIGPRRSDKSLLNFAKEIK